MLHSYEINKYIYVHIYVYKNIFTYIPHNTHKAGLLLKFLVCNDKEEQFLCYMLLHPRLLLSLLPVLYRQWYRIVPANIFKPPVSYSTYTVQTKQSAFCKHQNKQISMQ